MFNIYTNYYVYLLQKCIKEKETKNNNGWFLKIAERTWGLGFPAVKLIKNDIIIRNERIFFAMRKVTKMKTLNSNKNNNNHDDKKEINKKKAGQTTRTFQLPLVHLPPQTSTATPHPLFFSNRQERLFSPFERKK